MPPIGKWVATGYVYSVWARYPVLAGKVIALENQCFVPPLPKGEGDRG